MKIEYDVRPVLIDGIDKGLFHAWSHVSQIVPPSLLQGGHNGGVVSETFGIVELENGEIARYTPIRIRFLDSDAKFKEYCWERRFENT